MANDYNYFPKEAAAANTVLTGGGNAWLSAARIIVQNAAKNLDDAGNGGNKGINASNKAVGQQQGIQSGQAAPVSSGVKDDMVGQFHDSLLPGSERLIGRGVADTPSVAGGFAIQPVTVDSGQQTYQNSGMPNYLNYMKYRS